MDKSGEYVRTCDSLKIDSPLVPKSVIEGHESTTEDGYWHEGLSDSGGIRWIFCPSVSWLEEKIINRLGLRQKIELVGFPRFANDKESQDNFRAIISSGKPNFASPYCNSPEKALMHILKWQLKREKEVTTK